MKKQAGQDEEEEWQRLRKLALDGLASGVPQPDTPEDQAELRAIAGREQGRALWPESADAFHVRGDAAAADIERGGKTYTVDEVLDEMRAMTRARRRQLEGK